MAVETYPSLGQNVDVTLTTGSTYQGYWDGVQWWVGVNNDPNDVPLASTFVASWAQPG